MLETGNLTRILVVDDEPDLELLIRQRFRKKIKDRVYAFAFAANGKEALEMIDRDEPVDLILSDINMPVMDGLTFLANLRQRARVGLKTIIVSAYGDMGNIRTAMNRGAFDFVTKPIDFDDLEITIEKTIQQMRAERHAEAEHAELARVNRDLEVARRIQQAIIPCDYPPFPDRREFALYAEMRPAFQVGGDFYDYFLVSDHEVAVAIADVAGKGVPAALVMSATRALLKAEAMRQHVPSACLAAVNRHLSAENLASMFVSMFYGILDFRDGIFRYASAGHGMPYILTDVHTRQIPRARGAVLGVDGFSQYEDSDLVLERGDVLFFSTDGVIEAFSREKEEFGESRLESSLREAARQDGQRRDVRQLVRHVIGSVRGFADGSPQSDDMTAMALRYLGG
ncbi:MAG: SpoIIE family protein phosphatase [Bacteroidota bacterium]|jgi:sigma-B regulation protein RsbU (phosphoserine phosphatase)|nr:SpoIIE family protein phosphatase [Bacteroidota bacterium]